MTRCVAHERLRDLFAFAFAPIELAPNGERWHHRVMAKGKPTPEKSKIERDRPLAYSRRQKSSAGAGGSDPEDKPAEGDAATGEAPKSDAANADQPEAPKAEAESPAIEPPPPKGEPWPDATPPPMKPVEPPGRARAETMAMPPELLVGQPPAVPAAQAAGVVEDPTHMPSQREIPHGHPTDPAAPPGRVPSGDSRSLRKDNEFALIYRVQTTVISRFGVVGQRGQWRVVDYPTSASASSAYAKEVSRFVSEGFSDYRD